MPYLNYDIMEKHQFHMHSTKKEHANSLTNLPNQSVFKEQTEHVLEFCERTHANAVMLYITFDKLVSHINDQQNGLAQKAISQRLLSKARESDIYAHVGDMEFANLSIETSNEHVPVLVEKLKNELANPIQLEDSSFIKLNTKIGVAIFPAQGKDYDELLKFAKNSIT